VRNESGPGISSFPWLWTVKRAEARAPLLIFASLNKRLFMVWLEE
jgi:hypothetical protein